MQRALLVLVLIVSANASPAAAQELIQNGSFETNTGCPWSFSQLDFASPWYPPTLGSPDYFDVCGILPNVQVPSNALGTQAPFDGDAYSGGAFYVDTPNNCDGFREYLQAPLTQPLVAGQTYTFSMRISLADTSVFAIDKVGAWFTVGAATTSDACAFDVVPQIETTSGDFQDDMAGWMEVAGMFVAAGGEDHVTIGNLRTDSETGAILTGMPPPPPPLGDVAYYFVDDVSLQPFYECVPPPAGLIAWWPLDETGFPPAADVQSGYSGFWFGTPVPAPGYVDGCYEFDTGFVGVPAAAELGIGTSDFSIDAWIRPDVNQSSPIAAKIEDASTPGAGYVLYLSDKNRVCLVMRDSNGTHVAESLHEVIIGDWTFVAATVDRDQTIGGGRLYVNDQVTTCNLPPVVGDLANQEPFLIGHLPASTAGMPWEGSFEGAIDEVELFGVAVPEADLFGLYGAHTAGKCKTPSFDIPDVGIGTISGPVSKPIQSGRLIKRR